MKKRKSYPYRLLPKSQFQIITKWPSDINRFFVTRATEGNVRIDSKANLMSNLSYHIQASRFLNGLSVNLVAIYRRYDTRIAINYKGNPSYSTKWDGCQIARPSKCHIKHCRSGYFGFLIRDLLRVRLEEVDLKNNGKSNGKYNITFKLYHKPTNSNFWHCEFHIYGQSLDAANASGTMLELQQKGIVSKRAVEGIANSMMRDFEAIVKSKGEIKHRRLFNVYMKSFALNHLDDF